MMSKKNLAPDPKNTVAFQGVEGAHSDLACRQAYPYMQTLSKTSFDDVFTAVENGEAAIGLIPIENSHAGRVDEIHQILPRTKVHVVGEYFQPIEHHLLAPKGASLETIKTVYSHPQALMQCKESLKELPVTLESYSNTAAAAESVANWNDTSKAALASNLAAELYGLDIIKENMQDTEHNMTVFLAIAKEPIDPDPEEGPVITSLLFTARNIPAALYKALGGFATNNVNLLKIESYIPGGISATAQFFITFEGHPCERSVQLAIEELGFFSAKVKVLGVYPADKQRAA